MWVLWKISDLLHPYLADIPFLADDDNNGEAELQTLKELICEQASYTY